MSRFSSADRLFNHSNRLRQNAVHVCSHHPTHSQLPTVPWALVRQGRHRKSQNLVCDLFNQLISIDLLGPVTDSSYMLERRAQQPDHSSKGQDLQNIGEQSSQVPKVCTSVSDQTRIGLVIALV